MNTVNTAAHRNRFPVIEPIQPQWSGVLDGRRHRVRQCTGFP